MKEYRCKFCHRLLGKIDITDGKIEVKCPKCGKENTLEINTFPCAEDIVNCLI